MPANDFTKINEVIKKKKTAKKRSGNGSDSTRAKKKKQGVIEEVIKWECLHGTFVATAKVHDGAGNTNSTQINLGPESISFLEVFLDKSPFRKCCTKNGLDYSKTVNLGKPVKRKRDEEAEEDEEGEEEDEEAEDDEEDEEAEDDEEPEEIPEEKANDISENPDMYEERFEIAIPSEKYTTKVFVLPGVILKYGKSRKRVMLWTLNESEGSEGSEGGDEVEGTWEGIKDVYTMEILDKIDGRFPTLYDAQDEKIDHSRVEEESETQPMKKKKKKK
jgi:hypothetical protein